MLAIINFYKFSIWKLINVKRQEVQFFLNGYHWNDMMMITCILYCLILRTWISWMDEWYSENFAIGDVFLELWQHCFVKNKKRLDSFVKVTMRDVKCLSIFEIYLYREETVYHFLLQLFRIRVPHGASFWKKGDPL